MELNSVLKKILLMCEKEVHISLLLSNEDFSHCFSQKTIPTSLAAKMYISVRFSNIDYK